MHFPYMFMAMLHSQGISSRLTVLFSTKAGLSPKLLLLGSLMKIHPHRSSLLLADSSIQPVSFCQWPYCCRPICLLHESEFCMTGQVYSVLIVEILCSGLAMTSWRHEWPFRGVLLFTGKETWN